MNRTVKQMAKLCGPGWAAFWAPYNSVDNYARLIVCVIGVVTNVLTVSVFTQKKMRNPTNTILTALALADLLCVLRKMIDRSLCFYRATHGESRTWFQIAVEDLINEICFNLLHTCAIYLTLVIAVWRYLGVLYPLKSRSWCTGKTANFAIMGAILWSCILIPPMFTGIQFFNWTEFWDLPEESSMEENSTTTEIPEPVEVDPNPYYKAEQSVLGSQLKFWIHGLLIKIIPCLILTYFSLGLIRSLFQARRMRASLHESPMAMDQSKQQPGTNPEDKDKDKTKTKPVRTKAEAKSDAEFERTTKMLLVILLLFLVTELPFGVLGLVVEFLPASSGFYGACYNPIKPFLNLNEYISSSTSFFIYLVMSRNFRQTLLSNLADVRSLMVSGSRSSSDKKHRGHSSVTSTATTTSFSTVTNASSPV